MRRRLITIAGALVATACVLAAAGGPALGGSTPTAGKAHARMLECVQAAKPAGRSAVFQGVMSSLRHGKDRMAIRFDVQTHATGARRWLPLRGAGLGSWNRAEHGVMLFRFRKRIENLPAPAVYRAAVRFRWTRANGTTIATTRRVTRGCAQRVGLADLRLTGVTARSTSDASRVRYRLDIRNAGDGPAGMFAVALTIDGAKSSLPQVGPIAAGGHTVATVVARRCAPGGSLAVSLDSEDSVRESDESDNTATLACPTVRTRAGRRGSLDSALR